MFQNFIELSKSEQLSWMLTRPVYIRETDCPAASAKED
jgi:hypothetical protein